MKKVRWVKGYYGEEKSALIPLQWCGDEKELVDSILKFLDNAIKRYIHKKRATRNKIRRRKWR